MGIHLAHSYPHTNPRLHEQVPNSLKGVDMVLYESMHAAGLSCILLPIANSWKDVADLPEWFDRLEIGRRDSGDHVVSHGLSAITTYDLDEGTADKNDDSHDEDDEMDYADVEYESDDDSLNEKLDKYHAKRRSRKEAEDIIWLNRKRFQELDEVYLAVSSSWWMTEMERLTASKSTAIKQS